MAVVKTLGGVMFRRTYFSPANHLGRLHIAADSGIDILCSNSFASAFVERVARKRWEGEHCHAC